MRLADRLLLWATPVLAHGLINALHGTHRSSTLGEEHPGAFWQAGRNVIFALWHDQLLMVPKAYHGPGARILISASKDGELIARTMYRFGFAAVRGSSTRGGSAAFRELIAQARQPFDLALTPDGPRGPRHEVKDGVGALARLTGRPVIPLAFVASRGHRFSSWDRFLLPYPGARTVFRYGPPIVWQPGEAEASFRLRVQTGMDDNLQQAQRCLETDGLRAV